MPMQTPPASRVLATIERYGMIQPGDRVGIAVSGGGDSVALLLLFEHLREALGVTIVVLHFNHGLRGEAAEADERFVCELAGERGLACMVRREDVGAEAKRLGKNVEEVARERRYAFFRQLVTEGRVTRIATGHTADDQAETVLARLVRGSGLRGLAGIHPVLGPVVRPLIEIRRSELREYLRKRGHNWREDETNIDTSRLRARIRQRLLPSIEAEYGSGVVDRLARLADLARNDEALLDEVVEERFVRLCRHRGRELVLRAMDVADPWPQLKSREAREAIAARLARRAVREVKRDLRGLAAGHIARILELARQGTSGNRLELPGGVVVERALNELIFSVKGEWSRTKGQPAAYSYPVELGMRGEAALAIAETGKRLRLKLIDWPAVGRETYGGASGVLDADRLETPLSVRNWLPGDAYRPLGRGHRGKLKRLLLERRIAGKDRALWPVMTSGGKPVWTSGLPVAVEYAAGTETRRALLIFEDQVGGLSGREVLETAGRRRASK
ncbi:MAG: tRNA lysidine(34) synthetase TilS [Acidobacteriota bacterium]|nr:tRNA lysidine(34) synthetase TilS [Acidobacteriota bacterium]